MEPMSPTTKEQQARKYATFIGLDLESYPELYWIAEQGLCAELPEGWRLVQDPDMGTHHYLHVASGQSRLDHPMDDHYRVLAQREVQALQRRRAESAERAATASRAFRDIMSPATATGSPSQSYSSRRKLIRYYIYAVALLALVHFLLSTLFFRGLLKFVDLDDDDDDKDGDEVEEQAAAPSKEAAQAQAAPAAAQQQQAGDSSWWPW